MTVTAQSMKLLFSEFEDTEDHVIQFALDRAARLVDDTWNETDAVLAQSFLAAHYLAIQQSSADVGGRIITSESIGIISTSYGSATGGAASDVPMKATSYGQEYLSLLRRNRPCVATTAVV